jgi:hypothetical protein
MFSPKSKGKVNLRRLSAGLPREENTEARSIPVLRPLSEKRRIARKDLWCVCLIETKGGEKREGVIIDVSKTGARVRFRSRGKLPRVVRIKASRIGLRRFARVVWQSTFDAGLEFVSDHKVG